MKYMGSKAKIAKYIIPIMEKERKPNMTWVEPFVGGANVIDKVKGKRIGGDNNKYLIALWQALQQGYNPSINISKEEATFCRLNKDKFPDEYVGWVGIGVCSFRGKFFGGYVGGNLERNYILEAYKNITRQAEKIKDVVFVYSDYKNLNIPSNSLIYCDPPYASATKYTTGDFNHDEFWQWCREKYKEGHLVFVSEYNAPNDFECIWEKNIVTTLNNSKGKGGLERVEKLFKYKGE